MASNNQAPRACLGSIGSGGTNSRGCGCCCHGDRGQSSWRVGQQRLILVVVGCGLWVVLWARERCVL
jgi:hypothetical protein